jgi:transcriptional regulator with XRE-family HTH domain
MAEGGSAFGAKLKALRESAGLTQQELAARAGMHKLGVAKLEQGLREPTWATVQALAKALGLTCLDFVAEEGEAARQTPATMGRPRARPAEGNGPAEAKRPHGRPRKAPAVAQAERSGAETTQGPGKGDRPAAKKPGGRKGKGES